MPITPRRACRPLIALAAIVATLLATSEVSACSTMKPGMGACNTACGCCSSGANDPPTTRTGVVEPAAMPRVPAACQTAPVGDCSCRTQGPAAPTPKPKPARGTPQGRPELGQGSDFVHLGAAHVLRIALAPQVPATQSPPKVPLFLRNERLLF